MNTKGIIIRSALVSLAIAFTTGCTPQRAWVYHSNSYPAAVTGTGKTVAVLAFEDARENKNTSLYGMYLVPLVPYGWMDYHAPEGVNMHMNSGLWMNYKPTEDYPKALAEDLKKTGLFSDAFFEFRRASSDYAVKGKILNSKYTGRVFSYGLTFAGPILWFIGFPSTSVSTDLSVELSLVESKTDKALFTKVYTAPHRCDVSWLYVPKNDFNYSEMLAELNKQFCQDIQPVVLNAAKTQ
jgi:hypothetical protein